MFTSFLKQLVLLPFNLWYLQMVIQIIPVFSLVMRSSNARLQEHYLEQTAILIGIIKQHVQKFVSQIFDLVNKLWDTASLQLPLVTPC